MRRNAIFAILIASILVVVLSPVSAFADEELAAVSSDLDVETYLTKEDMQTIDIDTSYASYNSLPMFFYCDALEEYNDIYYDEEIKVVVYLKKPGSTYKKVKTFTVSQETYQEQHSDELNNYFGSDIDEDEYPESYSGPALKYDFKIKNLKPYTKYNVRVVCVTTEGKLKRTVTATFRTAHKPIAKSKVKSSGKINRWAKVKGAKGYLVNYRKAVYLGKNEYGTNMYCWKYAAKFTSKPSIKLSEDTQVTKVIPYTKIGKYYSLHGMDFLKSQAKITKMFKATSVTYYF